MNPDSIYTVPDGHFYVYILTNPLKPTVEWPNGQPFYVGKGKGDRAFRHFTETGHNSYKDRIIGKIKNAGLEYGVLCPWDGQDEKMAFWCERFLIALYKRRCDGGILTNVTLGGEGSSGVPCLPEQRKKISESNKGKVFTEEHRRNIGKASKGRFPSEATLAKISESLKRRYQEDPDFRERVREASKGRVPSEEHRKKISDALSGRVFSNDTIQRMREGQQRRHAVRAVRTHLLKFEPHSED